MTRDQNIVKFLRQRLSNWDPEEKCTVCLAKCCRYDGQGQLIELHLCNLQLAWVSPAIWQCSALQKLYLYNNQLSSLPISVGKLSSLQELYLSDNQLSTLPAEIGKLSSLQRLELQRNRLSSLPAEMGKLSALCELFLSNNRLRALPMGIGQLFSLQRLELYHNRLTTLPVQLGQLSSLDTIALGDNQLSTLPAEMGNLTSLRELYLWKNQLSTLPMELGKLSSLKMIDLSDNPLQTPPPEIIVQGISAILAYLRTLPQANETSGEKSSANRKETVPIKVFYCYAHEDKDLRDRIDSHLGVLKRLGHVVGWYDREIQAGTEWEREIEEHLSTASIILLLVSADFVNSDYCYGVEMQKALELHEKGRARVLPILLRPVDWQDAPFARLQILPTGAKPVTRWIDQDEALEDVAKQIRAVVTTLRIQQS